MKIYLNLFTLILFFLLTSTLALAQEKIYHILISIYRNDTIILKEFSIEEGSPTHFPTTDTGYYVEILSYKNEKLFHANLGVSFSIHVITFPGEMPNMPTELNEILINLRLPYFDEAKKILIYHFDKKIFEIDLSEFICNKNNNCEKELGENYFNCFEDCHCGNHICEKFIGETSRSCPEDCSYEETKKTIYVYLTLIVLIIVILIFFIHKIKVVR